MAPTSTKALVVGSERAIKNTLYECLVQTKVHFFLQQDENKIEANSLKLTQPIVLVGYKR